MTFDPIPVHHDPAPECPYCQRRAVLIDGKEIGASFTGRMFWICRPCDAWTGVHPDSGNRPLGRLANKFLRRAKQLAHARFDLVVRAVMLRDSIDYDYARRKAYAWLAEKMMIATRDCHIGFFDEALCMQAVEFCKTFEGIK